MSNMIYLTTKVYQNIIDEYYCQTFWAVFSNEMLHRRRRLKESKGNPSTEDGSDGGPTLKSVTEMSASKAKWRRISLESNQPPASDVEDPFL